MVKRFLLCSVLIAAIFIFGGEPSASDGRELTQIGPVTTKLAPNMQLVGRSFDFKNAAAAEEPGCIGDPVDTVTGHMHTFPQVDFVLPGTYGGMVFSRKYYSVSEIEGPFGYGWTHSYNITLTKRSDDIFEVMKEDGKLLLFVFFPDRRTFKPIMWNTHSLVRQLLNPGEPHPAYGMICKAKDGTKYIFPDVFWKEPDVRYHVSAIEYNNGSGIRFEPDDGSLPTQIIYPHGRVIRLSYLDGRITEIFEPGRPPNKPIHYSYDDRGNLTLVSYPVDKDTTYFRRYYYEDPHDPHNLTRLQDEHGFSMFYEYDQNGRCIILHGDDIGAGPLYKYINQYKPEEHQTVITRCRGNDRFTEIITYDNAGHIVRDEHIDSGEIEKYKYHLSMGGESVLEKTETNSSESSVFRKVVRLDEKFNITEVSVGKTESETQTPDTLRIKVSYDDPDNPATPTKVLDQNDNLLNIPQDALSKIEKLFRVKEAEALGQPPDINAFLVSAREGGVQNAQKTQIFHDEHGLVHKIAGDGEYSSEFRYDGAGRLAQIGEKKEEEEKKTQLAYDWLGRVIKVIVTEPDGLTRSESYEYDATDKFYPNAAYALNKIGFYGKRTQYLYNRGGFLWKVVEFESGGIPSITTYEYDSFGNLVKLTFPDGGSIIATYDSRDRLIEIRGSRSLLELALS